MSGRADKYRDPQDSDGNPLLWPGTMDGYPVRGAPPGLQMKQDEYEKLDHEFQHRSKIFTLPDQAADFDNIKSQILNRNWLKEHEEYHFDSATGTYKVLLCWVEIYGCLPPPKSIFDAGSF